MATLKIAPNPASEKARIEDLRLRLDIGSRNLRGIAAALSFLSQDLDDPHDPAMANILDLLSRDVAREAETMGDAEAYMNGISLGEGAA